MLGVTHFICFHFMRRLQHSSLQIRVPDPRAHHIRQPRKHQWRAVNFQHSEQRRHIPLEFEHQHHLHVVLWKPRRFERTCNDGNVSCHRHLSGFTGNPFILSDGCENWNCFGWYVTRRVLRKVCSDLDYTYFRKLQHIVFNWSCFNVLMNPYHLIVCLSPEIENTVRFTNLR